MRLETDVFDLWVFSRDSEPRYLLLHTSQEKADRWFGGARFWQIPGDRRSQGESLLDAIDRLLGSLDLTALGVWAVEHVYAIYNRRFDALQLTPVFAAEVTGVPAIMKTWEHDEAAWLSAEEAERRLVFRGLREGLVEVRRYITEMEQPAAEFRLR